MKLIERVYYSIKHQKIKTILLFLSVLLLGTFISTSFSIYQANQSLEKNIYENVNPIILIDWNQIDEEDYYSLEYEEKIIKIINELKSNEIIKFIENRYIFNDSTQYTNFYFSLRDETKNKIKIEYPITAYETNVTNGFIGIYAIDSYSISDFNNGNYELIYGDTFTKDEMDKGEYVFIYTSEYDTTPIYNQRIINAKKHYITIDNIRFNYTYNEVFSFEKEFILKGVGEKTYRNPLELRYHVNTYPRYLLIPLNTMKKINDELVVAIKECENKYDYLKKDRFINSNQLYSIEDTYIQLSNVHEVEGFIDELENKYGKYIDDIYSFEDSLNDIQTIVKNLNTISIISLIVCSIASIILLSLIILTFINERRKEIGIYLSLGEKKSKIIRQIIIEVILIGLLGITLSLFSGQMVGKHLSSDLLDKQIKQYETIYDIEDQNLNFEIDTEEIKETYSIEMNVEYVMSVYVGGVLVLLLSCIVPMRSIMKMNVKKMLL